MMTKDTALRAYRMMQRIRAFELRVEKLFAGGEIPGFVHLYIGQEASAAGVCACLEASDYITSTHRGHGHCIAKGGELRRMMAELFAKSTGYNKGKGGSMHIASPSIGILGANGVVGGGIPLATGAALASKLQKAGKVAISFFGDGASNQGSFHESVNLAAVLNLPVVYVCENNQFGVGTRFCDASKEPDVAKRAVAYAIPGVTADGMDVCSVYDAARSCVDRARSGGGPSILEVKTWRFRAHFQGEPASYRTKEEEQSWLKRDPLEIAKIRLAELSLMDEREAEQIRAEVASEIEEAVKFARESPAPSPADATADVFA